ncbi:MAG: DUF134 domain-containing protein [Candidatus Zapsychrus exili]|nr:DUF134 domain-containing protein [Candidatus Zapsychrus exili]
MTKKLTGRPVKTRYVKAKPGVAQFSPRGKPGRPHEVEMHVDEFEALRLIDYKNMKQWQACRFMGISRPTLTRIIKKARNKVADGIVNGKIIRIEGGCVKVG